MRLRDRTVIVTGASSGIGLETARRFARAGCNVVLASRNQERLEDLVEELSSLPGRRLAVATDVSQREQVEAMVERAVATFNGVDILVNNAGVGLDATVAEGDMDNMRYLFDVNFWGAIHCLRAAVPHMRRRKRGLIINVSSVAGRIAAPYYAIYCATKAALISLSDALRLELAEDGIRVLTVYPGFTATEFGRNAIKEIEIPTSRVFRGTPASAVARVIVKAARQGQREAFVTFGDMVAVGVKNVSPRLVDWGLRRLWLSSRRPKPLARK